MRKKLLVSGLCGCAAVTPAVALAAPADTTNSHAVTDELVHLTATPFLPADAIALQHQAAAKLHSAVKKVELKKRRARQRKLAAQQAAAVNQTAASSGGATDQTGGAPANLQAIQQCESGGNPSARSGSYGGLYQFDQQTWQSVGGSGDPAAASPAEQTMRAEMLMQQRGSNPWPVCGR